MLSLFDSPRAGWVLTERDHPPPARPRMRCGEACQSAYLGALGPPSRRLRSIELRRPKKRAREAWRAVAAGPARALDVASARFRRDGANEERHTTGCGGGGGWWGWGWGWWWGMGSRGKGVSSGLTEVTAMLRRAAWFALVFNIYVYTKIYISYSICV